MKKYTLIAIVITGIFLLSSLSTLHAKPLEIRMATQNPTTTWIHTHGYVPLADAMEKVTEGRLKVTIYPAQSLCRGPDFYEATQNGLVDMALGMPTYTPGVFPLYEITSLPFMGWPSAEDAGRVQWEIYKKFPEIQKEFSKIKVLSLPATGPYFIPTTKKPVKVVGDAAGLKLRAPGGRPADTLKAAGAVPTMVPMGELYIALEKGILDGAPIPWEGIWNIPLHKTPYINLNWDLWNIPFFFIMNKNTWNRIEKRDQDALMELFGKNGSAKFSKDVWDLSSIPAKQMISKAGGKLLYADPQEVKKWAEKASPITEKYLSDLEAKGLPARKVYAEIKRLIGECQNQ